MLQLDYLKLKLTNINWVNTKFLVPHPTIKNRYRLHIPGGKFNERSYYGDHIDIYLNNATLYLNASLPYLRFGHNFRSFDPIEVETTFKDLSQMLEVDLFKSKVIQREFAIIQHSKIPFKYLKKLIGGVAGMELQKKTPHLLMFGKTSLQCKIYEVAPNLKRKMHSSLRDDFRWASTKDMIKVELRFSKSQSRNLLDYLENEIHSDHKFLMSFMVNNIAICPIDYRGDSFSDILFKTLLSISWNYCSYEAVHNQILEHIDMADLTPSQKSARRKSLKEKQLNILSSEHTVFSDLLEEPEDYLPF